MDDYSSFILVAFVVILFTVFAIMQLKIGADNLQNKEGSRLKNLLRLIFAIPILIVAIIILALVLISLIP